MALNRDYKMVVLSDFVDICRARCAYPDAQNYEIRISYSIGEDSKPETLTKLVRRILATTSRKNSHERFITVAACRHEDAPRSAMGIFMNGMTKTCQSKP